MNNRIFFQHPDLMRQLKVHGDVMTIMMNVLINQQSVVEMEYNDQGLSNINVFFLEIFLKKLRTLRRWWSPVQDFYVIFVEHRE